MKSYIISKFFLLVFLLLSTLSYAQPDKIQANPVTWSFSFSKEKVKAGETVELIFKGKIKEDWYMYSSDFDPNLGPNVTTFEFIPDASYQLVGRIKPIGAHSKYDSAVWGGEYTYFKKNVEFKQKVKILKANPVIKATITYQTCNDVTGVCLPPFDVTNTFGGLAVEKLVDVQVAPNIPEKKPTTDTKKPVSTSSSKNISELEAEKDNLIKKDTQGNDVSVEYLKDFVNKYGSLK